MNTLPYIFDKYSEIFHGKKLFANVFSKYRLRGHSGITESGSLCGSDESRHNLYFESLALRNRRGISIFIDEYTSIINFIPESSSDYNVAVLSETKYIKAYPYHMILKMEEKFDLILTYDLELISKNPDKYQFIPADTVSLAQKYWGLHTNQKNQFMSHIYSHKEDTYGHKFRHDIAKTINNRYPGLIKCGGSGSGEYIRDKGTLVAPFLFSIIIENSKYSHYFTEKILDCFISGTVPIYWGSPSISKFFNSQGIIQFHDKGELVEIIEMLKKDPYNLYMGMYSHLVSNYALCKKYCYLDDLIIFKIIDTIPDSKKDSIIKFTLEPQSNLPEITNIEINKHIKQLLKFYS